MSGAANSADPDTLPSRRAGPARREPLQRPGRSIVIALLSTVAVSSVVGYLLVNAPGWSTVQESFFDGEVFAASLPDIARAFLVNVRLFLTAEVFILILALLLAVMRSLPGPVFFPIRAIAVVYIDFFRGVPGLLVIYLLGLGVPALQLPGVTNDVLV